MQHFAPVGSALDENALALVLSEIAETASETLDLQEVIERVAASIRRAVPFDHMGVIRIVENEWAVRHATTVDESECQACSEPAPLTVWSPRIRPRPGPIPPVHDAPQELDPSFAGDAGLIEDGVRSALWEPFHTAGAFRGGVWISAYRPHAFTEEHQRVMRPIAALLGSAVEHWRIWDAERRRQERLDQLEAVLGTLAESLDVREIFGRISGAIQHLLPHSLLALTEIDVRVPCFRVIAVAGEADIDPPIDKTFLLTPAELERRGSEFEIVSDLPAQLTPETERERLLVSTGMRSWLRVPVWISGEVRGSLGFFHREPSRYRWEDAEIARRVADRIALMLSHQRLAEEARVAAEARERAERLAATVETLTREMESRHHGRVVGVSRSWKEALAAVGRVAGSETTVMLTGESGTGKEVISRLIHQGSPRSSRPFVAINCAALPEQLLESELFGHERGAFTGATAAKVGRLEQAAGGTLFLDEIGEMSPAVQAKLLRVLQEREFQRVGGTRAIRADVRIIAATNRDLEEALARQQFREDLYYRLNVFEIHLAPLRERPEDVLVLAEAFLEDLGRSMGRPAAGISRDAREWMLSYSWPGNARELRNAIERALLLCDGGLITRAHLPAGMARAGGNGVAEASGPIPPGGLNLEALERGYVEKALAQAKGNKSRAARLLGLTRAQLYSRLEKHGLS